MRLVMIGLAALLPVALGACSVHIHTDSWAGGKTMTGSGKRTSEVRSVPAFHGVEFGGSGSVRISVGQPQKVTVEIDDNLLKNVTTEVRDGVLHIGTKGSFSSDQGVRATIQVPTLDMVEMSGSGSANVEGLRDADLDAQLTGSGEIEASGTAKQVRLEISGSGQADLSRLKARDVVANISGSGSARVDASESLKADISGSGSVSYTGNPHRVEKNVSGSGSVSAGG